MNIEPTLYPGLSEWEATNIQGDMSDLIVARFAYV